MRPVAAPAAARAVTGSAPSPPTVVQAVVMPRRSACATRATRSDALPRGITNPALSGITRALFLTSHKPTRPIASHANPPSGHRVGVRSAARHLRSGTDDDAPWRHAPSASGED